MGTDEDAFALYVGVVEVAEAHDLGFSR